MQTELLESNEDKAHVENRIKGTALEDHEAWIRFWSETSIQLDGNFTASEIMLIADIMRTLPSALANDKSEPRAQPEKL